MLNNGIYILRIVAALMAVISLVPALTGCGRDSHDPVEFALEAAGSNRAELEKVLEHYKDDTLKLRAAKFLIANMPGHISYRDRQGAERFCDALDSLLMSLRGSDYETVRGAVDSLMASGATGFVKDGYVQDLEIVDAGFLIHNIDDALSAWEESPWARHLDFDEFCETLLPYKAYELQPLDGWRERYRGCYDEGIEQLDYCSLYESSPVRAAMTINRNLRDSLRPDIRSYDYPAKIVRLSTRINMPYGVCADYADIALAVMRANGIPVVRDFVPVWGYRPIGHEWDAVEGTDGKWEPFGGVLTDPGTNDKLDERKAKVYRTTYSHNPAIIAMIASGEYVPPSMRSPFMRDVTGDYIPCRDITFEGDAKGYEYLYLALPDVAGWSAVDFCRADDGIFKNVGVNNLYAVIGYDKRGNMSVLEHPFVLDRLAGKRYVEADTSTRESVVLWRKYPALPHVAEAAMRTFGGEFHASDDGAFRGFTRIHRVNDAYATAHEVRIADSVPPFRYWRYKQDGRSKHCNMAEIQFYAEDEIGDEKEIRGEIIGTDGSFLNPPTATKYEVFDGDLLTIFEAPIDSGGWVGMDFGKPVKLSRIVYTGRGDGNSIENGDLYELFYYGDGGWVSLGRKRGDGLSLRYDNAPRGALFLLRDLTKGKEERVFTYEDGRQKWW